MNQTNKNKTKRNEKKLKKTCQKFKKVIEKINCKKGKKVHATTHSTPARSTKQSKGIKHGQKGRQSRDSNRERKNSDGVWCR